MGSLFGLALFTLYLHSVLGTASIYALYTLECALCCMHSLRDANQKTGLEQWCNVAPKTPEIRTSSNQKLKLLFFLQTFGGRDSLLVPLNCYSAVHREMTMKCPEFLQLSI